MLNKHKKIITLILVLLLSQVGLIYILLDSGNQNLLQSIEKIKLPGKDKNSLLASHDSYHMKKSFYDQAYKHGSSDIKIAKDKVYGGIIPHHIFAKEKIAAWFMGLPDTDYETVILIGPNHFDVGPTNIIISQNKWNTPYGDLLPDLELGKKLVSDKNVAIDEGPFVNEHSISGLIPFIKNSLPDAKVLPIILKLNTNKEDLDFLAKQIINNTNKEKTLVLASVDFSHYQPSLVADFHDDLSKAVIEDFDFERIHNLEIDSPASIYAVLKYLENINTQKSNLVFHTNSSTLLKNPDEPGTSHLYYYFGDGPPSTQNSISMLFFGDMMLDRNVKDKVDTKGIGYIFDTLGGEENRFFMSPDIVSANLEGALTNNGAHYPPEASIDFAIDPKYIKDIRDKYYFNFFALANNHIIDQGYRGMEETAQNLRNLDINFTGCGDAVVDDCSETSLAVAKQKVGIAAFSMVYNPFDVDKALDKIKSLKNENDLVVAQVHWGVEYEHQFNTTQQELAHQIIDAGADIIIGHHPHVVQGMEIYKNKPIFYSLGNFVFDQYFSEDTQQELGVGIHYEQGNYQIYLFPILSTGSQLSLMKAGERDVFLNKFIDWSEIDESYKNQIKQGRIILQ